MIEFGTVIVDSLPVLAYPKGVRTPLGWFTRDYKFAVLSRRGSGRIKYLLSEQGWVVETDGEHRYVMVMPEDEPSTWPFWALVAGFFGFIGAVVWWLL